jgi:hypothetical protein
MEQHGLTSKRPVLTESLTTGAISAFDDLAAV